MAVAFDSVSSAAGATSTTSPLTFSHTVIGSNNVLLAGIAVDASPDTGLTCTCTYGGSAMTSLGVVHAGAISSGFLQVFAIIAVAGTANVVATVAGGTAANIGGGSIAFNGAGTTVALAHGTPATANTPTNTTTATCALASNTNGNIIAGFTCSGTGITSATAPSTSRFLKSLTGAGAAGSVAGATSPATGSSVTMAWVMQADDFAELMVEILPFGGGGGPIRLAQQQSRALVKRRKQSQRPQFNMQSPDVSILLSPVTATALVVQPFVVSQIPYITGLAGGGTGYFQDQNGNPRLVLGEAPWALPGNAGRWNSGNWQADFDGYCAGRAAQGYTAIYTKPIGTLGSGGALGGIDNNGGTFDSLFPFQGGTPSTGVAGANPSTGLTSTYWARIDYFLNRAQALGLTVFLNAIGYDTDFSSGPGPLFGKSAAEFTAYGTALGTRYASQPNLVWMCADDYFGENDTLIAAWLTGVRSTSDTHVVAIENMPESDSRQDLGNNAVLTWGNANAQFTFVYTYAPTYLGIEHAYAESSPIPVIQGDGYFYAGVSATLDRAIRQDCWWTLTSGARGYMTGSEAIWKWDSSALANTTSGANQNWYVNVAGKVRTAFESLPGWHLLLPATGTTLITAGRGTRATPFTSGGGGGQYEPAFTNSYVSASLVPGGSLAVMYLPNATTITVDETKMAGGAGHYTATWIDPVTGATSSATPGTTYNSTAKGNNSAGDPDWVLALQATAQLPELAMATRIAP